MSWPTSADYFEAVQNLEQTMGDPELRAGQAALRGWGCRCPVGSLGRRVPDPQRADRQHLGAEVLQASDRGTGGPLSADRRTLAEARLPFMMDFQYLAEGVRIRGAWYRR